MLKPRLRNGITLLNKTYLRNISSLSPLAVAFNERPSNRISYKWNLKNAGLFKINELKKADGFYELKAKAEAQVKQLVSEATSPNRRRNVVQIFDDLSDSLCQVADLADFVRIGHTDELYKTAAEDVCFQLGGLVEELNTHVPIYDALKQVENGVDHQPMDDIDTTVARLFLFDFEQSGIHLPESTRKKFVELNDEILSVGAQFQANTQQPAVFETAVLPPTFRELFAPQPGNTVTISGLNNDSPNAMIRRASYCLYMHENPLQTALFERLLHARFSQAQLVGFETFAHRSLTNTLAGAPETVTSFLDALSEQARPFVDEEFKELGALKKQLEGDSMLNMWDFSYLSSLSRSRRYHLKCSDLSPFFSLGSCMEGLNIVFNALFGVKLVATELEPAESWAPDVHKLAVIHETEGELGIIYCDFFEREGKFHQDCHFTVRGGRRRDDGSYQNPIVVLHLNLPPPTKNTPSLLSPSAMENLFHEFGHAMHSMLGRTRYQHVTGTRCATDFAEVPSILMEYFATDPRILRQFARHWETGEALGEDQMRRMLKSRNVFAASELQLQLFYAALDQAFHGKHPLLGTTADVLEQVQMQYHSIPHEPNTALHLRFSHFVGYGARYYSYLYSRAVASRLWADCFSQDPLSRCAGEKYRAEILAHGGGKPPAALIKSMLGFEPAASALVTSVIDDLRNR